MLVTYKSGGQDIPTNVFSPSTAANGGLIILAYGSDGLVDSQNGPWKSMIEGYAMDLAAKGFLATIPEYFAASGTQPGDLNPSDPVGYMKQVLAHRAAWQVVELLDPDRNSNGRRPLERTRSFVLAYATDDEIQRLTREGILVEQLQAQSTFAVSLKALSQSPA